MKIEEQKKLQNVFKSNLNEISKGRFKSKEQQSALENIKLNYESREAVIKLFIDYSSVVFEAKYKTTIGEGRSSGLATRLKILTPKQLLQRLPIAVALVKAGNTSETY